MQKVRETANTIHWLFSPIGHKEPAENKVSNNNLNIIQKTNPATIIGLAGVIIGAILGIFGVSKENKISKWFGSIIAIAGGILGAFGINKASSQTVHQLPVTGEQLTPEKNQTIITTKPGSTTSTTFKLTEEEQKIRDEIHIAMTKTASKICKELNLDPKVLEKLMPNIVPLSSIRKKMLDNDTVRSYFLSLPKKLLEQHSRQLLEYLPKNLKKELFPPNGNIPDTIKGNSKLLEGGGYITKYHLIGFEPELIKQGVYTAEEIGTHEAYHAISAILRTLLAKEEAKEFIQALKEEIKSGICYGRPWKSFYRNGYTHQPFVQSRTLRQKIAEATVSIIEKLTDPGSTYELPVASSIKLDAEDLHELENFLNLEEEHEDFLQYFDNNIEDALKLIGNYIENEVFRFLYITESYRDTNEHLQTITLPDTITNNRNFANLKLTPEAKKLAYNLVRNFPELFEGNSKITLKDYTESKYSTDDKLNYAFAYEEIKCKVASIQDALSHTETTKHPTLNARLKIYELGERLAGLRKKAFTTTSLNPNTLKRYYQVRLAGIKLANLNEAINNKLEEIASAVERNTSNKAEEIKKLIQKKHQISASVQMLMAKKEDENNKHNEQLKLNTHQLLDTSTSILQIYIRHFKTLDSTAHILLKDITATKELIDKAIDSEEEVQKFTSIITDNALLAEIEKTEKDILKLLPAAEISMLEPKDFETVRLGAA